RVLSSEWTAELDEKDEEYERKVDALAGEPIPAELDWGYVDRFTKAWEQLRPKPATGYRRCVFHRLEQKFVRIDRAALRVFTKEFPRPDQGATCAVMRAAVERMMPFLRTLQLYGGDCPEIEQANAAISQGFQSLAAAVLARPHTFADLECFYGALLAGMLGAQTEPMEAALQDAITAARANA